MEEAVRLGLRVVQFGPNLKARWDELARANDFGLELEVGLVGLDIAQAIARARSSGASFVRTVLQEDAVDVPPPSEIERKLRALVPVLDDEGVALGLENSVIPAATLRKIIESIGSRRLGITLDTVNSLAIGEGWRHVLEELAPYTLCLHVKDFTIRREWHRMGFRILGAPAGEGDLDVPCLLDRLRAAGFRGNAILEQWVPEQAQIEETIALERKWAEKSIRYLRELIQE